MYVSKNDGHCRRLYSKYIVDRGEFFVTGIHLWLYKKYSIFRIFYRILILFDQQMTFLTVGYWEFPEENDKLNFSENVSENYKILSSIFVFFWWFLKSFSNPCNRFFATNTNMKKVNYSNVYNGYNNVYRVLAYGYSVPEVKKKVNAH